MRAYNGYKLNGWKNLPLTLATVDAIFARGFGYQSTGRAGGNNFRCPRHVCVEAAIGLPGSFAPPFHSEKPLRHVLESRHRSWRGPVGFALDVDTGTSSAMIARLVIA